MNNLIEKHLGKKLYENENWNLKEAYPDIYRGIMEIKKTINQAKRNYGPNEEKEIIKKIIKLLGMKM